MAANMEWAESLLSEARAAIDLPALAAPDAVLMRDTGLQNTFICQPQQRNMAGRIFGGFLMRRAYELAFATCYMFAGVRPVFQEVDEVTFEKPVSIGDLLRFRSHVLHTARSPDDPSQGRVHIEVVTTIVQPEATSSNISNMFNFNFSVTQRPLPDASPTPLKRVLPSTTEEAARIWDYYPGST